MRTFLRGKVTLLFMMCAVLLAIPAVAAFADQLRDELVSNNAANNIATITQNDPNGFVNTYHLDATGSGANVAGQCDVDNTHPVTFSIDTPAGVTASPNTLTFKQCGDGTTNTQDVKFTSDTPNPTGYTITATQTSSTPSPAIATGNATFTLKVNAAPTPSDTTAPVISKVVTGTQGNNGWYTSNVGVDWTVVDNESAISSQSGCADFSVTSDQNSTTYTCSATSAGGTSSDSVTIKRDATAPQVNLGGASGTAGDNGWYTSAVTQTFNASDATSGLVGASSFTRSSGANEEGSNVSIGSGLVYDNAGNSASNSASFKVDLSDPVANCDSAPAAWSATDVSINCQPTDAVSGLANTADANFNLSTSVANGTETANASTDSRVVADAAGRTVTAGPITNIKVDKKAPVITDDGPTATPDGTNGWYKTAVTNNFTATDGGSGFAPSGALTKAISESSGTVEGSAVKIASGTVSDAVGNEGASIDSAAFKIDLSNPTNVAFVGGPAGGSSPYFGSVPAAPTCTADDAVSGLKDCVVTGYSTAVGPHTMTATATDNSGRTTTATRSYTVLAWNLGTFKAPVDMGMKNNAKAGSTVPLKFNVFAGTTELTSTSVVSTFTQKTPCDPTLAGDDIEQYATGGTSLRYSGTPGVDGQFIFNWQTPKAAGSCYRVTVTTQDGSSISSIFQLK